MISDADIKTVTTAFVEIANGTGILEAVTGQYNTGNRSLGIRIVGGSKFKTGFMVVDGKIKMMGLLDQPTVMATIEKTTFWNIINAPDSDIARMMIYTAMYTEQTIEMEPPVGSGAELHFENILKIFAAVASEVMS